MALEHGLENRNKNARKRPVQPVVPVVPYVAPRKPPTKPQVEERSGNNSPAQNLTPPPGEVPEIVASHVDTDALEELASNSTPAEALVDTSHAAGSPSRNSIHSELPPAVIDEIPHINGNATPAADLEAQPTKIAFAETNQQDDHGVDHQINSEEHVEPPNVMEATLSAQPEENLAEAQIEADAMKQPVSGHVPTDVPADTDKTPISISKHTATAEVVEQRPKARFPHRKSELAPEVLTNGNGRTLSSNADQSHQSSSSVSSQRAPLPTIYEHFLYLFNSKQLCDTIIQVNSPDQMTPPVVHYGHAVVLIRSERIAKLLPDQDAQSQSRIINLYPARTIQPYAFEAALRFLYSDQVLSAEALFPRDVTTDKQVRGHLLDYLMSYWMAGVELRLEPVKTRSQDFLKEFIDWDVTETVMKEAYTLRSLASSADGAPPSESALMSQAIFAIVTRFIVDRINLNRFKLDVDAQSHILPSRFSSLESGRATPNPALASMVFGSMPSHPITSPSEDTVASIVFLNMDFTDLEPLASELVAWHGTDAIGVLTQVIEERERRRAHVISNRMIPNKQRLSNSVAWENAGWREYFEKSILKRERVGFMLPTKQR